MSESVKTTSSKAFAKREFHNSCCHAGAKRHTSTFKSLQLNLALLKGRLDDFNLPMAMGVGKGAEGRETFKSAQLHRCTDAYSPASLLPSSRSVPIPVRRAFVLHCRGGCTRGGQVCQACRRKKSTQKKRGKTKRTDGHLGETEEEKRNDEKKKKERNKRECRGKSEQRERRGNESCRRWKGRGGGCESSLTWTDLARSKQSSRSDGPSLQLP